MTEHNKSGKLQACLNSLGEGPDIIAAELRLMAAGDDRYHELETQSPWIKNIWNAAADIIEENLRRTAH